MTTATSPFAQQQRAMLILVSFHLFIIALSNYLVQIPVEIFGLTLTWGAITFPFIFLATDLTVRLFGAALARNIIYTAMMPALILSYVFSVLFSEGQFQGLSALGTFNSFVARIAVASFAAYTVGQLLDVKVFDRLRRASYWWVAPALSTLVGSFVDTLVFFSLAFYQSSDLFMASHWPEMALFDYGVKVVMSILLFIPAYGLVMNTVVRYFQPTAQSNA